MPHRPRQWRYCWFPWLTLVVAALWVVTARQQAPQIRECNSTRIVSSLLVGGMGLGGPAEKASPASTTAVQHASSPPSSSLMSSFSLLTSGPRPSRDVTSPEAKSSLANLQKAGRTVETVVYVWERMMYGVAALLFAAAVVSLLTGHTRITHLGAAAIMILATGATLIGMQIIEHPSAGDMPPLPLNRHLLAVATLSAYAWILLIAFARRLKPTNNIADDDLLGRGPLPETNALKS